MARLTLRPHNVLNSFLEASGESKMENPWRGLVLSVDKVIAPMSTIHEGKVLKCNVSPASPASIERKKYHVYELQDWGYFLTKGQVINI